MLPRSAWTQKRAVLFLTCQTRVSTTPPSQRTLVFHRAAIGSSTDTSPTFHNPDWQDQSQIPAAPFTPSLVTLVPRAPIKQMCSAIRRNFFAQTHTMPRKDILSSAWIERPLAISRERTNGGGSERWLRAQCYIWSLSFLYQWVSSGRKSRELRCR
ncbi:hypothetical protein BKA63DRAFT_113986 [Paraphoma chrysanthemicola]|nr:hypothetical protein BKA63DRAFT_113986 [Paraphoma chrysanthemicola]